MIKVSNISKSFGKIEALKQVNFEIKPGEIFGFIGPNGAGKSTTINILSTLLEPDSGEIFLDGVDLRNNRDSSKLKIGVVPQEISLYEDLSAFQNLMFWGSLYNIPTGELRSKSKEALEMVGLSERQNDAIKTYSGGMKRRVNIASSILHRPKILLLDEPTVGVDPQSRNHIFDIVKKLNSEGMTIIYTTHYMEEVERLCDTIAIIDLGHIVAKGTLEELKLRSDTHDILCIKATGLTETVINKLKEKLTFQHEHTTNLLEIVCNKIGDEISNIINLLQSEGVVIQSLNTKTTNLETIFLKLTGKQLRD